MKIIVGVAGAAIVASAVALAIVDPALAPLAYALGMMGASMTIGAIADALGGASPTEMSIHSPAAPRSTIYGETRLAGVVVYESTTGHQLNQVIVWAAHQCQSVDVLYLDGKELHQDGSGGGDGNTYYDDSGNKYHWGHEVAAWHSLGTAAGYWFGQLNAQNSAQWTSDCTLNGLCATYLKATASTSQFSGNPGVRAAIHGKCDIYDPRTQTHGYTNNAALVIADFLCNPNFGVGCIYAVEIDEPALIAAANLCDEQVPLASGGTESRYTINGTFPWTSTPGDVLDSLLMSCEGRITYTGGRWKILPAAWYPSGLTFDQTQVVSNVQWTPVRKLRDKCNAVRATYICPIYPYARVGYDRNHKDPNIFNGKYQPTDMPEYAQDALHGYASDLNLAADGGNKLYVDRRYQFVSSCATAQRLAKIFLLRNRQQGSGILTMNLAAYQLEAQDVFQLSFPALNWSFKYLEPTKTSFTAHPGDAVNGPTLDVALELNEADPSVYTWSVAEERGVEDTPSPVRADSLQVLPPTAMVLESATSAIVGVDGVVRPRIHVTWTTPDDPFVTTGGHINIRHKLTSDTAWSHAAVYAGDVTSAYILDVVAGISYDVEIFASRATGAASTAVDGTHVVSVQRSVLSGSDMLYPNGNTVNYLQPAQPGADVTALQPIVYTGASESIIPNGDFLLGNMLGWVPNGFSYGTDGAGPRIHSPSAGNGYGTTSPSFGVVPGQKYRITFKLYNSAGSGGLYLHIGYAPSFAANILLGSLFTALMDYGSVTTTPTVYSYDWTCPAGINFASLLLFANGASDLACQSVSCTPYGAAAQWGADVTASHITTRFVQLLADFTVTPASSWLTIPQITWAVNVAATTDVFNIALNIGWAPGSGGGSPSATLLSCSPFIDGAGYYGGGSFSAWNQSSGNQLASGYMTLTGLTPGSHTIDIRVEYASSSSPKVLAASSAILQQIH